MLQLSSYLEQKEYQPNIVDEQTVKFLCEQAILEEFGATGRVYICVHSCRPPNIYLHVKNSQWSSVVWLYRSVLVEKINKKCPGVGIKEIKVITK
jgi:hypothetical protein